MKPKMRMRENNEAASAIMGVFLMVAITVILAAVVGAFIFYTGVNEPTTPQASLLISDFNSSTDTFTITHQGGDTIQWNNTKITVNGTLVDSDAISGMDTTDYKFSTDNRVTVTAPVPITNGGRVLIVDTISKTLISQATI